jgi:hypothetical protein
MRGGLLNPFFQNGVDLYGNGYSSSQGVSWYVRPSGGSYGNEDGTSYDNAWDGFSNIVWASIQPGDTLYVAGTHNQEMTVGASGTAALRIKIASLIADPATINGADIRNTCINATNRTYLEFEDLTLIDAVDSCLYLQNGNYIIRGVTASGASGVGGQGFQNETGTIATYYDCIGEGCIDDGMSLHVNANVTAYDCIFRNNSQGVNGISTSVFRAYRCSFSGNSTSAFQPDSSADFQAFNCYFEDTISANSTVQTKIYNSVVNNALANGTVLGNLLMEDCLFLGTAGTQTGGSATFRRCLSKSSLANTFATTGAGSIVMEYCVLNPASATTLLRHVSSGTFQIRNCTIRGTGSTAISCTVAGFTATNCIFNTLQNAASAIGASAVVTLNFCNVFNVSVPTFTSGGGTVTINNAVAGNPTLSNVGVDDYSLLPGSVAINAGTNTGVSTGITFTGTTWGDASTTPVVATAEQSGTYDLGAYL